MLKHKVIIIPGLGDPVEPTRKASNHWRRHGLEPVIYPMKWRTDNKSFESKLKGLIEKIDEFVENGDTVSLVGTSAGASAAINAFAKRKSSIHKVINICGRLKKGSSVGFRSFEVQSKSSPAFAESIRVCEENLKNFSKKDLEKIMTVKPAFGDQLVPHNTVVIKGARNIRIPTIEHVFSILMSLTLFSRPLIKFLKDT
jgi:hypothetical protein